MNNQLYIRSLLLISLLWAAACDAYRPPDEQTVADSTALMAPDSMDRDTPSAAPLIADTPEIATEEAVSPPPREEPPAQRPRQKPTRQEEPRQPQQAAETFKEGQYRLVQVDDENLPFVMDMTTECDTRLLSGELSLRDGQFHFQSYTAAECKGRAVEQERHEAEGNYRLDGKQLYLKIRYGDALGDAQGVVDGNTIRLKQIGTQEEQQNVNWLFRLQ